MLGEETGKEMSFLMTRFKYRFLAIVRITDAVYTEKTH